MQLWRPVQGWGQAHAHASGSTQRKMQQGSGTDCKDVPIVKRRLFRKRPHARSLRLAALLGLFRFLVCTFTLFWFGQP